jgi:N-methylhydantoinase A
MEQIYDEMTAEARKALAAEGFDEDQQAMLRSIDVRYSGQEHTVTVAIPDNVADAACVAASVERDFTELHERQYGHTMDDPIEITTLRLRATGQIDKPGLPRLTPRGEGAAQDQTPVPDGTRPVYEPGQPGGAAYARYARESLLAGDEIAGPAVISEHTATTVIHAGDRLRVGGHGELVITVGTERRA